MGTYVTAEIVYGFTVKEPEPDWGADYDEDAVEPEPVDLWELLKPFPLLSYDYAGDSQWDDSDRTAIVYVKAGKVRADEDAVVRFDPRGTDLLDVGLEAHDALDAVRAALPERMNLGPNGWHLYWDRG